jgi:hypothetical protein
VAKDKRDRRDNSLLGTFNRQRFEQEVAEEIGISLDRTIGRAGRPAKTAAASPGPGGGAGGSRPNEAGGRGETRRPGETGPESEAGRRGATIRRGEKEKDEKS